MTRSEMRLAAPIVVGAPQAQISNGDGMFGGERPRIARGGGSHPRFPSDSEQLTQLQEPAVENSVVQMFLGGEPYERAAVVSWQSSAKVFVRSLASCLSQLEDVH